MTTTTCLLSAKKDTRVYRRYNDRRLDEHPAGMGGTDRPGQEDRHRDGSGVRGFILYGGYPFARGIDGKGKTQLASARICAVDYSDPEGTFVLNEGNMSSDNGSVIYITANGRLINYAYWRMNGSELGKWGQDMFIADGKAYIISQNGGNDGILVEADARTLKRTGKFGKATCPDFHAVACGRNRPDGLYPRQCRRIQTRSRLRKRSSFIEGSQGALKKPHGGRRQQSVRSCGQIYPGLGKRGPWPKRSRWMAR